MTGNKCFFHFSLGRLDATMPIYVLYCLLLMFLLTDSIFLLHCQILGWYYVHKYKSRYPCWVQTACPAASRCLFSFLLLSNAFCVWGFVLFLFFVFTTERTLLLLKRVKYCWVWVSDSRYRCGFKRERYPTVATCLAYLIPRQHTRPRFYPAYIWLIYVCL